MIVIDHTTALYLSGSGYGVIMDTAPHRCRTCRGMHYWFINRNGSTQCQQCDGDQQRAMGAEQEDL